MTDSNKEFLMWIHDRLENIHHEDRNTDYMIGLRQIANNADDIEKEIKSLHGQVSILKAALKIVL